MKKWDLELSYGIGFTVSGVAAETGTGKRKGTAHGEKQYNSYGCMCGCRRTGVRAV